MCSPCRLVFNDHQPFQGIQIFIQGWTCSTGYEFERFCIDEENKRIIAYFIDREEPLGYFDIPVE